jgi:hypothetical protein
MTLSLLDISQQSFPTTPDADGNCEKLRKALGFKYRYPAARLAIARSLALPDRSPVLPEDIDGLLRPIPAQQLFGDDLSAWISLLFQSAGRGDLNRDELRRLVAAHWHRGAELVSRDWDDCERDLGRFIEHLAQIGGLPAIGGAEESGDTFDDVSPTRLELPIGPVSTDLATGEPVRWRMNARGNSPHAAIMGGVNSGKTRTTTHILRELRQQMDVPLIAFDFKGDMADDQNALDDAFGAEVISPPHQPIPLNVLALGEKTPASVALAAQRFRDTLTTLRGGSFGQLQKGLLGDAAEAALRAKSPCQLSDVRDSLKQLYRAQGRKDDGAIVTLNDLCKFDLFQPELTPTEFFRKSWIIRLTSELPDNVRVPVVTLITDALDRYLNVLPDAPADAEQNRSLRVVCVIDEANRILGSRLPGLTNLIRLSRSKGGSIMLISQSPNDFEGEEDDFLAEMGLVVAFSTNADPKAVRRIIGPMANLTALEPGQAWAKLREPVARHIRAWG